MKHNSEKVEKEKWKQLHQVNHPLARSSSLLCHVKESLFRKHFFSAEFHWIFEPFDESLLTLLAETIKKAFCGLNFWRKLFCFSTFTIQLYNGWRENFSRIKGVERLHWILLCIRCWLSRGLKVVRKMTRNEFLYGKYYKVILTLKKNLPKNLILNCSWENRIQKILLKPKIFRSLSIASRIWRVETSFVINSISSKLSPSSDGINVAAKIKMIKFMFAKLEAFTSDEMCMKGAESSCCLIAFELLFSLSCGSRCDYQHRQIS